MRLTALAATLMLSGGAASAATTGFTLAISGNFNTPTLTLTNISTTALLTEFSMTIGNTSRNFDYVFNINAPTVDSITQTAGDNANNGARTDDFAFAFTGFGPGESANWQVDVDTDNANTTLDYRTVFFNNGAAANSVISALFSDGRTVALTLPDGSNDPSYTFTAATQVSAVPVPAALPLLATALGALGLASRRRKG